MEKPHLGRKQRLRETLGGWLHHPLGSLCMQAQSCHIRPVMLSALQISTKHQAMLEAEINEDTQEDGFLDLSAL